MWQIILVVEVEQLVRHVCVCVPSDGWPNVYCNNVATELLLQTAAKTEIDTNFKVQITHDYTLIPKFLKTFRTKPKSCQIFYWTSPQKARNLHLSDLWNKKLHIICSILNYWKCFCIIWKCELCFNFFPLFSLFHYFIFSIFSPRNKEYSEKSAVFASFSSLCDRVSYTSLLLFSLVFSSVVWLPN